MKGIEDVKTFVPQVVRVHRSIQMYSFEETDVFHTKCGESLRDNRERAVKNDVSDGGFKHDHILLLERRVQVAELPARERQQNAYCDGRGDSSQSKQKSSGTAATHGREKNKLEHIELAEDSIWRSRMLVNGFGCVRFMQQWLFQR
jgi:hypothetical protein